MADDSVPHSEHLKHLASRRRFVAGAGAAGLAGLAGCSGGASNGTTDGGSGGTKDGGDTTSGQQGNPVDPELTLDSLGVPASNVQWNEFNFANYKWMVQAHIMDPFAIYDPIDNRFVGMLLDSWSIDLGTRTMTLKINDDYHWHDGEKVVKPVTSEDFYRHFKMEQYMGWSSSNYVANIKTPDKKTVKFDLKGDAKNKDFIKWNLLLNVLSHGMPVYDKWLNRFENEKDDKVAKNLSSFSISSEDMISYGPFAVKSASKAKLKAVKNTGHPASKEINFPEMAWKYIGGSGQKLWQALSSGGLDGHVRMNVPSDVALSFPDHVEYTTYQSLGGLAVNFNWDGETTSDPRVRKAICYIVDKKQATRNAGGAIRDPITSNTGMAPNYAWDYVNQSNYTNYSKNHEKATQLLKAAGYTQKSGKWYKPNGDRWGPELKAGAGGGPRLLAAQTIASQLQSFGLDTRLQTYEGTTYVDNILSQGNYQLAVSGWGAGYPHPYAWYNANITNKDRKAKGIPATIDLPPVGKPDGNRGAISFNIDETVQSLTQVRSDQIDSVVQKLAWMYNWGAAQLQVYETKNMTWFTNDDWEYPPLDSDIMQRKYYTPFHYILKTGKFKAETK